MRVSGKLLFLPLIVAIVFFTAFALQQCWNWGTAKMPFVRADWIADSNGDSRIAMARYMSENQTLTGMSELAVKEFLGFGLSKGDEEVVPHKLLKFHVSGRCRYADFYVHIEAGKVTSASLNQD